MRRTKELLATCLLVIAASGCGGGNTDIFFSHTMEGTYERYDHSFSGAVALVAENKRSSSARLQSDLNERAETPCQIAGIDSVCTKTLQVGGFLWGPFTGEFHELKFFDYAVPPPYSNYQYRVVDHDVTSCTYGDGQSCAIIMKTFAAVPFTATESGCIANNATVCNNVSYIP